MVLAADAHVADLYSCGRGQAGPGSSAPTAPSRCSLGPWGGASPRLVGPLGPLHCGEKNIDKKQGKPWVKPWVKH